MNNKVEMLCTKQAYNRKPLRPPYKNRYSHVFCKTGTCISKVSISLIISYTYANGAIPIKLVYKEIITLAGFVFQTVLQTYMMSSRGLKIMC